jgi:hypothetical protein
MKKTIAVFLMIGFIIINGCNSETQKPEMVVASFFDALSKQDFETAKSFSTKKSESVLDLISLASNLQIEKMDNSMFDKSRLQFGTPKIEGDSAIVEVSIKNSNEFIPLKLKKEDGDWKVAFDAETLMKMGLDKIKTEGRKNGQQLDKQLESIQNMPLDSLKDEMQNSLQKLDSVQKTLDI